MLLSTSRMLSCGGEIPSAVKLIVGNHPADQQAFLQKKTAQRKSFGFRLISQDHKLTARSPVPPAKSKGNERFKAGGDERKFIRCEKSLDNLVASAISTVHSLPQTVSKRWQDAGLRSRRIVGRWPDGRFSRTSQTV